MYVPIDVNFPDDPKIMEVGPEAAGIYVMALCVAKRLLTDGELTRTHLVRLGASDEVIERLHASDLVRSDGSGRVQIVAFLDHNDSADEVMRKRASDAQRKRRERAARRKSPASVQSDASDPSESVRPLEVETETEIEAEENHSSELALVPAPGAPAAPERSTYPAPFEAFWNECPRKTGKGAAAKAFAKATKRPGVRPERITEAMRSHAARWAQWPEGDRQFIPHPATWLNECRYDDEPPPVRRVSGPATKADRNQQAIEQSLARMTGGGAS